ncbi:MAG: GcvT family protein [SAR324 cluster bacterium]|nr:GcvT family protein [SAR324 cluster bacterium]
MSELPKHAHAVIIGAGIVGNSVACHLAKLGWKDLVLIEKGPLPNTGGSTGHASNFIFPVDHSKEMTQVTLDSLKQFKDLGVFRESGGIELARSEERMQELRRRMASSKAWGIDSSLISPNEVKKLFPWVDPDVILGGFYTPSAGVVDSLRAGTLMREKAIELDALKVFTNTEITDIAVKQGRVSGISTTRGEISTEIVVICCGVWSPRIARMAGASISLSPVVHQMIDVGPIAEFEDCTEEIEYPVLRDMDKFMYERQVGRNLEIGSYAHRPIIVRPDDIPSIEASKLSPTEMPFTKDDFDPQLEDAMELLPEMLDKDEVEIQYSINGLLSLTPDGEPIIGETAEVKGLWSCAAIWIKEAPGFGRMIAEWMTDGISEIDNHGVDISRLYEYARTENFVESRAEEAFNKTYGIVHPNEQWGMSRGLRVSPFYAREKDLNAEFYETAGWERPYWYNSNQKLLEEFSDRMPDRTQEWDARWWSPIIKAEHLAMRERAAMFDLTAFAVFDIKGPGALDYVQKMAVNQMDVRVGRSVYTPLLNDRANIKTDLTIMRLGDDFFRVVTGGSDGSRDKKWFSDHLPDDHSASLADMTSAVCTIGLWGPRSREIIQSLTKTDMSHEGFPFGSVQEIVLDRIRVHALRISYVGDLGWEIHIPMEYGQFVWDLLWEAGQPLGLIPSGIGVYGTTGRLEKGYRLYGAELDADHNPLEAGLARPKVKSQNFIGKEAYLEAREKEPDAIMCTLTVEDHKSASGELRFMLGGEPIVTLSDGKRIVDRHGRSSYVTSAGEGPSLGKYILMAYLPPEYVNNDNALAVEYFSELFPVRVAVAGGGSLFDPDNERMLK